MSKTLHRLKKYVSHPSMQLATGLILLISGIATTYHEFQAADYSFRFGVHHGVMLWALVQVLASLADLIDGIERSIEAVERHRQA